MPSLRLDDFARSLTTNELLDWIEFYTWERCELEEDEYEWFRDEGIAYLDAMVAGLSEIVQRRAHLSRQYAANRNLRGRESMRERFEAAKRAVGVTDFLFDQGVALDHRSVVSGRRVVIRCPLGLHDDSTPSFTIYPSDQGWYCFGCGRGGTVIDLAMLMGRHMDPRHALSDVEQVARAQMIPGLAVR